MVKFKFEDSEKFNQLERQRKGLEQMVARETVNIVFVREGENEKPEVLLTQGPSGKWYFPGGKVRDEGELKETKFEALKREVQEEIGVDISELIKENKLAYQDATLHKGITRQGKFYLMHTYATDKEIANNAKKQEDDSILDALWTDDPLSFDLSENARKVLERGIRIGDRLIKFPKTKTS